MLHIPNISEQNRNYCAHLRLDLYGKLRYNSSIAHKKPRIAHRGMILHQIQICNARCIPQSTTRAARISPR